MKLGASGIFSLYLRREYHKNNRDDRVRARRPFGESCMRFRSSVGPRRSRPSEVARLYPRPNRRMAALDLLGEGPLQNHPLQNCRLIIRSVRDGYCNFGEEF